MKKDMVIKIGYVVTLILLIVVLITLVSMYMNGIRWNTDLGLYDTRVYHGTLGEFMRGVKHFTYTDLSLIEAIKRIFV